MAYNHAILTPPHHLITFRNEGKLDEINQLRTKHSRRIPMQLTRKTFYIEVWKIRTRQVSEYIDIPNFLRVTRGLARVVVHLISILTSKNCSTCLRFKFYIMSNQLYAMTD